MKLHCQHSWLIVVKRTQQHVKCLSPDRLESIYRTLLYPKDRLSCLPKALLSLCLSFLLPDEKCLIICKSWTAANRHQSAWTGLTQDIAIGNDWLAGGSDLIPEHGCSKLKQKVWSITKLSLFNIESIMNRFHGAIDILENHGSITSLDITIECKPFTIEYCKSLQRLPLKKMCILGVGAVDLIKVGHPTCSVLKIMEHGEAKSYLDVDVWPRLTHADIDGYVRTNIPNLEVCGELSEIIEHNAQEEDRSLITTLRIISSLVCFTSNSRWCVQNRISSLSDGFKNLKCLSIRLNNTDLSIPFGTLPKLRELCIDIIDRTWNMSWEIWHKVFRILPRLDKFEMETRIKGNPGPTIRVLPPCPYMHTLTIPFHLKIDHYDMIHQFRLLRDLTVRNFEHWNTLLANTDIRVYSLTKCN